MLPKFVNDYILSTFFFYISIRIQGKLNITDFERENFRESTSIEYYIVHSKASKQASTSRRESQEM